MVWKDIFYVSVWFFEINFGFGGIQIVGEFKSGFAMNFMLNYILVVSGGGGVGKHNRTKNNNSLKTLWKL